MPGSGLWCGGDDRSRMNLAVLGTVFGAVFVAELPDKTALASLVLGTRYRPGYVFAGVAAAFALHVVLAVSAGSLLFLLPHRVMQAVVGALFLAGAAAMLRRREEGAAPDDGRDRADEPQPGGGQDRGDGRQPGGGAPVRDEPRGGLATLTRPALSAARAVMPGTGTSPLATANLAARYHDPFAVGTGALLGLCAVGGLAIVGGRQLLRVVPFRWITRAAAIVMAGLAVVSLIAATAG